MVLSSTRSIYLFSRSTRCISVFNSSPICSSIRRKNVRHLASKISDDASSGNNNDTTQQLRIAVVGGGAAGMTAALHLSPLVSAGLIQTVDIYESTQTQKNKADLIQHRDSGHEDDSAAGKQLYPGSGALGRNIGVGIWSTAWWPFLKSLQQGMGSTDDNIPKQKNRQSFKTLLQDLESCGSYVGDVGYRTPNGSWLVKSELNSHPFGIDDLLNNSNEEKTKSIEEDIANPALLFVRERDLLSCLRNAIKIEQRLGTVKYHSGIRVNGIDNINGELGSLILQHTDDIENESLSWMSPQYHLIIAADGIYSSLRSRFAGHNSAHVTAGMTLGDPQNMVESEWDHTKGQREATQIEDREYVVFRGNAPKLESDEEDGSGSFQTWGENRNMRFAAVPFNHETEDLDDDEDDTSNSGGHYSQSQSFKSKQQYEEVWFATMSDPSFVHKANAAATSHDAEERKQMLLEAFGSWHKPISTLISNTPADEIMYEIAIAHRHNTAPVFDVARIMEFELLQDKMAKAKEDGKDLKNINSDDVKINGQGPTLVFLGDAQMAIDPVLAQGFTMAMEAGASLAKSIEGTLTQAPADGASSSGEYPTYQPDLLQQQLLQRHYSRERRLLQLLRSTELVQILAQPSGFGATLATWFIRPVIMLCPEILKKRVFDYMLRYSLGLTGKKDEADR